MSFMWSWNMISWLLLCRLVLNYENVLHHPSFKLMWVFRTSIIRFYMWTVHVLNSAYVCVCSFVMSQRHYKVSARRWFTLDAVELEYNGTKATFNGSRNVYAPAEYSYRCESVTNFRWPLLVPRSSKDPANQWRVSFEDFQVIWNEIVHSVL